MPQLDKLTYFTQFFWSCLFFFTFYILICNDRDGVLGISRILKLRNQLLSHRGNGTKSKDLRPGSLEDILRKGFNTGVSYMYSSLFEVSQWCKAVDLFGKRKKITLISCFLAFLIFSSFILLVLYYPMVLLLILGRVLTMARGFHFIFDFTGLNTRWFLFTLSVMTLFSCSLSVGPLGFPIPEEVEAVGQVDAPSSLRDIERFLSLSEGSSRPPVEEGGVEGGEEISSEVPPELDPFLFYQFHGEPAFWRLFNSQEATIELQSRHLLGELVFNERPAGELLGRLVELEVTLEQRIFALLIQKPDEGLGLSCSFVFNNRAAIRRIIFGLGKRGNRGRPPSEYILELYNLGLQMDLIGVRNSALFRELEKNLYKLRL